MSASWKDIRQWFSQGAGHVVVALGPEGAPAGQKLTITGSSQQSAAISADFVDLACDTACFVELGANPTAVLDTSYRVVADVTYRFPIRLA